MKKHILSKLQKAEDLSIDEMVYLFETNEVDLRDALMQAAYEMKRNMVGGVVYFRGIIELSNQCVKDCGYCGIRRSNTELKRYRMEISEIVQTAMWANQMEYASIVLQSGERTDSDFVEYIETVLTEIKKATNGKLRVTLSLGVQEQETYRRWHEAGAERYLLRVETTNKDVFERIHPDGQTLKARVESLLALREAGYQVGTGVMIGLPGQTALNLVDDILFFKEKDIDMIGMGPYLLHEGTPVAEMAQDYDEAVQFELSLRMIALTRLCLKDVNIAATTALQAIKSDGREQGIMCGANVIMPKLTDTQYRQAYQLYDGKPCMDENKEQCMGCLSGRIEKLGESVALGKWGDAPHYIKRTNNRGAM